MDPDKEIGLWLMQEARLSYRYWHSSVEPRKTFKNPFFDRTQCEWILKQYRGKQDKRLA